MSTHKDPGRIIRLGLECEIDYVVWEYIERFLMRKPNIGLYLGKIYGTNRSVRNISDDRGQSILQSLVQR